MLELEFDSPVLDSRATVLSQLYRRKAESFSPENKQTNKQKTKYRCSISHTTSRVFSEAHQVPEVKKAGGGELGGGEGAIAGVIPWSGSRFSSLNQFPCIKKKGESGSQTGFVVEGGSLNGWKGGGYQACLLYTSDAADDWLVV